MTSKIKILYEDKDILVVDKPSGISVHPDGKTKDPSTGSGQEETISDWFIKNYPKAKNVGESIFVDGKEIKKPGIVHRLDKETSGVLILVKNQKAYEFLKAQFSAPALRLKTESGLADKKEGIRKTYVAIVSGWVKNDRGTIRKSIGRSGNDFRKRLAGRGARGELREAITEYTVLKRFESACAQNFSSCALLWAQKGKQSGTLRGKNFMHKHSFTFLEVRPKTGRTHQIRVHMKFINHPVINDSLYNPNQPHPKEIERLGLHAKSIEFKDLKGKTIKIESPLPLEFKKLL